MRLGKRNETDPEGAMRGVCFIAVCLIYANQAWKGREGERNGATDPPPGVEVVQEIQEFQISTGEFKDNVVHCRRFFAPRCSLSGKRAASPSATLLLHRQVVLYKRKSPKMLKNKHWVWAQVISSINMQIFTYFDACWMFMTFKT